MASQIPKYHPCHLPIEHIRRPKGREPDPANVAQLEESIRVVGVLHPAILNRRNEVLDGLDRIQASLNVGLKTIPAVKMTEDDLRCRIAAMDANVCRKHISTLALAESLAERKRLYEALHPETRQGGAPGKRGGGKANTATVASFANDAAQATGKSPRTIRLHTEVASKLTPAAKEQVRGTSVEGSITKLKAIADRQEEDQVEAASAAVAKAKKPKPRSKAAPTALIVQFDEEPYGVGTTAKLHPFLLGGHPIIDSNLALACYVMAERLYTLNVVARDDRNHHAHTKQLLRLLGRSKFTKKAVVAWLERAKSIQAKEERDLSKRLAAPNPQKTKAGATRRAA